MSQEKEKRIRIYIGEEENIYKEKEEEMSEMGDTEVFRRSNGEKWEVKIMRRRKK